MFRIALIAVILLAGCAQKPPASRLETLTPVQLEKRLETAAAPGVVFGTINTDGSGFVRAAGYADLASGRKTTADTPFAWFSITKLFTATAVLQLSEKGLVDLDAPAERYLPGMHLRRDGQTATVRQLLSHSAGVPDPGPIIVTWIHLAEEQGPAIEDMIAKRIGDEPELDFVPGTKSQYSNLGYVLLGRIVERVSGVRYERYVEQNVLAPLGCRDSGFAVAAQRATAYHRKSGLMAYVQRWLVGDRYVAGTINGYWQLQPFTVDGLPHGGLNGPADCLLRFARMTLQDGKGENGSVLSSDSVRAMLAPAMQLDGSPSPFGLAWRLGTVDGEPYADHDGGGGGYRAELRVYPRRGYGVVVLGNETAFSTEEWVRIVAPESAKAD